MYIEYLSEGLDGREPVMFIGSDMDIPRIKKLVDSFKKVAPYWTGDGEAPVDNTMQAAYGVIDVYKWEEAFSDLDNDFTDPGYGFPSLYALLTCGVETVHWGEIWDRGGPDFSIQSRGVLQVGEGSGHHTERYDLSHISEICKRMGLPR